MLDLLLCISRLIVLRILNSLLSRKFLEKGEKNSDFFSFFVFDLIVIRFIYGHKYTSIWNGLFGIKDFSILFYI